MSDEQAFYLPLSQGKRVRVDEDVVEKFGDSRWSFKGDKNGRGYAVRNYYDDNNNRRLLPLARALTCPPTGFEVVFLNGDTLDCRRSNLKVVTKQEANCRHKARKDAGTGLRGISYNELDRTYSAGYRLDGVYHHVGTFFSLEVAQRAYDEAMRHRDEILERRRQAELNRVRVGNSSV